MPEIKDILQEYVATANDPKYKSDFTVINSKFPELKGYDPRLLEEYVATANNEKYGSDFEIINSKFPELFTEQEKKKPLSFGSELPYGNASKTLPLSPSVKNVSQSPSQLPSENSGVDIGYKTAAAVPVQAGEKIDAMRQKLNLMTERNKNTALRIGEKQQLKQYEGAISESQKQLDQLGAIVEDESQPIEARQAAQESAKKIIEDSKGLFDEYGKKIEMYNGLVNNDAKISNDLNLTERGIKRLGEKEYNTWQNFAESFGKHTVDAAAGVAGIFNTLGLSGDTEGGDNYDREAVQAETRDNIQKIRNVGQSLVTQEKPEAYKSLFSGKLSAGKVLDFTLESISSTVPTVAAGLLTGGGGTALTGAGMMFGESKDIMKEAGLDEEQSDWAALGLAIPLGLLESYGVHDIVGALNRSGVTKKVALELGKQFAGKKLTREQLFNASKRALGKAIAEEAPVILKTGLKEAGTEVTQGGVNEVAKQAAQEVTGVDTDENMSTSDYAMQQLKQRGEEAIGGFVAGGVLQGVGTGIEAATRSYTPSTYQRAIEYKDPSLFEDFQAQLQKEVADKIITPKQADEAVKNVQSIQQADELIPKTLISLDARADAVNLLIEKQELKSEVEGKDESLSTPIKNRIAEIDTRLADIAEGKPQKEESTPEAKSDLVVDNESDSDINTTPNEKLQQPNPVPTENVGAESTGTTTNEAAVGNEKGAGSESSGGDTSIPVGATEPTDNSSVTQSAGEQVNDISVGEMVDKTGFYNGEKGSFYQDGQSVIFKVDGKNKEYELGNIEEIKDIPVSDFNISHEKSVVDINDNGEITIRGDVFKNNYSNPLAAINTDENGNFVSVSLETTNRKKRTFRGNIGEDIAYQIHLKEINKNNETRAKFEQFLNEDEGASKEMDNGAVLETSESKPVVNNEKVSREKINTGGKNATTERIVEKDDTTEHKNGDTRGKTDKTGSRDSLRNGGESKEKKATVKSGRKKLAEAKVDEVAAVLKDFLPSVKGVSKSGVSQDKIIDLVASAVKALVNAGIEIDEAIKQVKTKLSESFDVDELKDEDIKSAIDNPNSKGYKTNEKNVRQMAKKFEYEGHEIDNSLRNYIPVTFEDAAIKADQLIEELGIEDTVRLMEQLPSWVDMRFVPAIANRLIAKINTEQDSSPNEKLLQQRNRVYNITLPASTYAGQSLAMWKMFYEGDPYNQVKEVTQHLDKLNEATIAKMNNLLLSLNVANKNAIETAATNVVKSVGSTKVEVARKKYEKSAADLKKTWNALKVVGIAENPYESAKKNTAFEKALATTAKDFIIYKSVKFSQFIKEVATNLGVKESDIDSVHLKEIFDKVKEKEIRKGVKGALSDMDMKLKDLIVDHYTELNETEQSLVDKLSEQFGLEEKDAKEVAEAVRSEVKKLSAEQKLKALKNSGLAKGGWWNELLTLSDSGALSSEEVRKKFGAKIGIKELTQAQTDRLLELANKIKKEQNPRVKSRLAQDIEDYKGSLKQRFGIGDFLVSDFLTNIFASLGSNEINIASNMMEHVLLYADITFEAIASGNPKDALQALKSLANGFERGFDFTKEVIRTGKTSYRGHEDLKPRNMWELIMMRDGDDLTRVESALQTMFSLPYVGKAMLAERRFWNRALLSMDALSGVANTELGAMRNVQKDANKLGLRGKERTRYIKEQLGNTPEIQAEAEAKATELGYQKGTKVYRQFVSDYKISKRPQEITERAKAYSALATLTQEPPKHTMVGAMASIINSMAKKHKSVKYIFPVVNTFSNLIIKNIERSPFEFVSLGFDLVRVNTGNMDSQNLTQDEKVRRFKAATFGTLAGVLLFMAAGGFNDDDEGFQIYGQGTGDPIRDAAMRALGWKPYSIRFTTDGGYWSFEYFPIGFMLAIVGDMRDYYKYGDDPTLKLRQSLSEKMFDEPLDKLDDTQRSELETELNSGKYYTTEKQKQLYTEAGFKFAITPYKYSTQLVKNVAELVGLAEGKNTGEKAEKAIGNTLRGIAAPRYLGEGKEVFDPNLYDSKNFWSTVSANVPFVKFDEAVKLDGFGRNITKYDREEGAKGVVQGAVYVLGRRFYSPARGTEVDRFLTQNQIKIYPPQNTVDLAFPEESYKKYIIVRGEGLLKSIQDAKNEGDFDDKTPLEIKKLIDEKIEEENESAQKIIKEELGREY